MGDESKFTSTGCEEHSDSIARLYAAAFNRDPERAGFRYWFDLYRSGDLSLVPMAALFADSDEFVGTYGALGDEAFIQQLYRNSLGRQGEAAGVDYWVGQLAAGDERGLILLRFAESPENIARTGTAQPILGPFSDGVIGGFDCSRF